MSNVQFYNVFEKPEALPVMTGSWKCHQKIFRSRISRKNILVWHYMAVISIFYWITIYFTSKPGLLQLFDDVITHDNDVIWIQSLDGWPWVVLSYEPVGYLYPCSYDSLWALKVPQVLDFRKYSNFWWRQNRPKWRQINLIFASQKYLGLIFNIHQEFFWLHASNAVFDLVFFWCFDFSRLKKSIKAWPY